MVDKVRIDKWLWAARFFKTRALASEAIAKNRIRISGQRIKPSRHVTIGDVITIEKTPYQFTITVLGLDDRRRPASEAQLLYAESEQSIEARHELGQRLRNDALAHAGIAGVGRPSKKQRRQIIRFQNQNDQKSEENNDSDTDP